jgi:flagellar motor switch protein FliN
MAEQQPPENESAPVPEMPDLNSASVGDSSGMDQSAIDDLLKQATFEDAVSPPASSASPAPAEAAAAAGESVATMEAPAASAPPPPTQPLDLPDFQQVMSDANLSSIDLLRDVDLNVKIELGRTRMLVEDVLKLAEGSVVELDKLAGDPVDVFVNERLIARGEVLVLNDNFCVRINEIVSGVKEEGL